MMLSNARFDALLDFRDRFGCGFFHRRVRQLFCRHLMQLDLTPISLFEGAVAKRVGRCPDKLCYDATCRSRFFELSPP